MTVPEYLGIDALRNRLFSELKIELQTKDLESLIREFDNHSRKELNFPSLLSASHLTHDNWRKTGIRKSESKSARKNKQEEKAIAPDILGIMEIVKQASYNLLVANDNRINTSRPNVMDSSQFKLSLEDLSINISENERKTLEARYSQADVNGKIDFSRFRSEFQMLGAEKFREKEELRVPPITTGKQQAESDIKNMAHLSMLAKFDAAIGVDFDASCSLESSMSLSILAPTSQNKNKGPMNSQFMNKMVLTNVALEDIFAATVSANNTPDKQKLAPTTFDNRRHSKGTLKPLQPPLGPLSESELVSECVSRTSVDFTVNKVTEGDYSKKAAIYELASSGPTSDDSETDQTRSWEASEKDIPSAPTLTELEVESSKNAGDQSHIALVRISNSVPVERNIHDTADTGGSLDSRLQKQKECGRNSSDRGPTFPSITPKKNSRGDLGESTDRLDDNRSSHSSGECPPVASAIQSVASVRTEKPIAVNNDDVIEAITRKVEELAAAERRAALNRVRNIETMAGAERRNSFQRSESADSRPAFVPGKRRYSRDPINHSKIIELTGRMELKTSARPADVRSMCDGPEQAELDEEVESAETPEKKFLEKRKKGDVKNARSHGFDDMTCLDVEDNCSYYIQR